MDNKKQKQQKQQNTKQTPPQNHIIVKRWNSLRLSRMSATNPGSHFIFSRKWSRSIASIPGYCVQGRASSTCFLFFSLQDDTPCWLPRNCTAMTCSSCRTWSYMPLRIPSSPQNFIGRPGWRSRRKRFQAVDQSLQPFLLSSVLTSSFISSPGWLVPHSCPFLLLLFFRAFHLPSSILRIGSRSNILWFRAGSRYRYYCGDAYQYPLPSFPYASQIILLSKTSSPAS